MLFSYYSSVLQNTVETESSSGEKPVLFLLLKMLVSSSNAPLRSLTKRLVLKVSNNLVQTESKAAIYSLHVLFPTVCLA